MPTHSNKIAELRNILKRLKESKRSWKTELVVFWSFADNYLNPAYLNIGKGGTKIPFHLPAFYKSNAKITAKQMYAFCTTRDDHLSYAHLVYIFSIFEEFVRIASLPANPNVAKWPKVVLLLEKWNIDNKNILELTLAKEVRNCFVHYNGRVGRPPWLPDNTVVPFIEAYKKSRNKQPPIAEWDAIRDAFPGKRKNKHGAVMNRLLENIQKWHNLIVKCSAKILTQEIKAANTNSIP